MPRSPLTEPLLRVQGMIAHVRENLSTDEYMLFLDLLAPEPTPVKPQKKSSKKAAGGGGRSGSKSQRASGIAKTLNDNLSQRRQETIDDVVEHDTEEPTRCQFIRADGSTCKLLADHNIHHLTTAREYHYFVAPVADTGKSDAQSAAGGS